MPKQTTATISTTTTDTRTGTVRRKGGNSTALQAHRAEQAEWGARLAQPPRFVTQRFSENLRPINPAPCHGKPRTSAFFFFANLQRALVNAGGEPVLAPPLAPMPPQTLPKQMTLTATVQSIVLSLSLSCSPYTEKVIIYGAAPAMEDTTLYDGDYRVIGHLASIPNGGADLSDFYSLAFGVPEDGQKIAVKLMGVSAAGYTTTKQPVEALTGVVSAASEDSGDGEPSLPENGPLALAQ